MIDYPELQTVRDFLRWASSRFQEAGLFFGHGTDNPWDEACALVFHTLHLSHTLYANVLDAHLTQTERHMLFECFQRRIQDRLPTPYLTHEAFFANLAFYVDERVLIPRSPIAELIEHQFHPWIHLEQVEHILDLCTGSGCMAVACAHYFPNAMVDASDISEKALAVAKINLLRHHVEKQVTLLASDLFLSIPEKKYDIIVSNPPYANTLEMAELPPEYHHEPALGLHAGNEGLDYIVQILQNASRYLKPKSILVVEVGNSESALLSRYPKIPFTWIELEKGDSGIFLLTGEQVHRYCKELDVRCT